MQCQSMDSELGVNSNCRFSWRPTSLEKLIQAERKILQHLWDQIEGKYVSICNGAKQIWTIAMNKKAKSTPLVMVHGMGAGVGMWALNLESISAKRPLYAMDVLGFGRSSRPKFSTDPRIAEMEFVESIEEWRKAEKLEKFVLMGHSLGGFITASYAMKYPERVEHLILVDPWGLPELPSESERNRPIPVWIKVAVTIMQPFNPLGIVRLAGPWGPSLIRRFRPDLLNKFDSIHDEETVTDYIYHCNAQQPSGEAAFKSLNQMFGWAKNPIITRINDLDKNTPMTLIYGSESWMDRGTGYHIKYLREGSYVDVQVISGAGHHVYADRAEIFNNTVSRICDMVDNNTVNCEPNN